MFSVLFFANSILANPLDIYQKQSPVELKTKLDKCLNENWQKQKLELPLEASDSVFLRRAYLDLVGRLPRVEEVKLYLDNKDNNKQELLIDNLVDSEEFANYWTMYFVDLLRVKSEFPINLWPNAVYVYEKRINDFLIKKEPYNLFVKALILGQGSNFRNPESNFFRAVSSKDSEGIARAVAQTFLGVNYDKLPVGEQKSLKSFFECVKYKSSKEWKEEIVYIDYPTKNQDFTLPNGKKVVVQANQDPREVLFEYLTSKDNPYFAKALVNRVWFYFFNDNFSQDNDDLLSETKLQDVLDYLAQYVIENDYSLQDLCKLIAKSAAYRSSAFANSEQAKSQKYFNTYKIHRLHAEVIDDMINDISSSRSQFSSVIPEPFSFIDSSKRTTELADGSIANAFLILFGRSVRDTGKLDERLNLITAKQRQQLFNSSQLYAKIRKIMGNNEIKKMPLPKRIDYLYLLFFSRYPSNEEFELAKQYVGKNWQNFNNLAWSLMNTQEFIYQH